jgi:4-hydroxy-tetrahydrodipicolinate synthase
VSPAPVVFSAVPTLFGPDGELDPGANRALYKLLAGQLDGLLVAGTTGEFPALDDAERLSLIELALAEAGPERVIAHIGAPDARHASRLAQAAVALGATRLAAITPYYLPVRPDELTNHYRAIRAAAPGPELYAYIFPERTSVSLPPDLFAVVADAAGLAGAKISGAAAAEVYAALRDGTSGAQAQQLLDRIVALGASVGRLKYALHLRGFGGGTARMTIDPPDEPTAAAIAAVVAAW